MHQTPTPYTYLNNHQSSPTPLLKLSTPPLPLPKCSINQPQTARNSKVCALKLATSRRQYEGTTLITGCFESARRGRAWDAGKNGEARSGRTCSAAAPRGIYHKCPGACKMQARVIARLKFISQARSDPPRPRGPRRRNFLGLG